MTRSNPSTCRARPSCTYDSHRPTRSATTWRASVCSTRCGSACSNWVGTRSKLLTRISAGRRRGWLRAADSNAWWLTCVWARWARSRRAKSRALRATAAGGRRWVGVGAGAARKVSLFARNSREWQQLVEVCRVVDTVLVDQETVYAPRQSNDRLLLGLKGSLNEYELDLLRQRSVEARREKAKRGELIVAAPAGYVKGEDRLEKDPDLRV